MKQIKTCPVCGAAFTGRASWCPACSEDRKWISNGAAGFMSKREYGPGTWADAKITQPKKSSQPYRRFRIKAARLWYAMKGSECPYTGEVLTPETASWDHVRPYHQGGPSVIENLQFISKKANRIKAGLSHDELVNFAHRVASRFPRRID